MGFCGIKYVVGFALCRLGKRFKNVTYSYIFYAGIQFAVRKCACAALSELYVALSVKYSGAPEQLDILYSFFNALASFYQNRLHACHSENICRKKSCRTASYNDRFFT